jgi:hypothetical protein
MPAIEPAPAAPGQTVQDLLNPSGPAANETVGVPVPDIKLEDTSYSTNV